jgi:nitrite reductase/ring-hydroxylating ferredoxin subunit
VLSLADCLCSIGAIYESGAIDDFLESEMKMDQIWTEIDSKAEFTSELRAVMLGSEKILISRLEGKFFACLAKCPHAGMSMEHAEIESTILVCPLHGWRFDMKRSGAEVHGYRGLVMRDVKVENGTVFVAV